MSRPAARGRSCLLSGACSDQASFPPWLTRLSRSLGLTASSMVPPRLRRKQGCGTSDKHKLWLNTDACGIITASLTWIIVLYCNWVVITQVLGSWYAHHVLQRVLHCIFFMSFSTLALISHAKAMLSNPGAVPLSSKPTHTSGWNRLCQKCDNHKPSRAHHCSVCGRCVIKMGEDRAAPRRHPQGCSAQPSPFIFSPFLPADHHCPWVNNCVGLANQKFFLLFLLYTFIISAYAVTLLAGHVTSCMSAFRPECVEVSPGQGIAMLTLCVCAILFGLFTGCMMLDQSSSVTSGLTQIDRYHQNQTTEVSRGAALAEVFGGHEADGFQLHWLLPTPIKYVNPESLTGYCFRDTPKPRTNEEMESLL
jgi:palmitoyltransferase ZDHHC3/7/25